MWLGIFAGLFPNLSRMLRIVGVPVNGYMPWVRPRTGKLLIGGELDPRVFLVKESAEDLLELALCEPDPALKDDWPVKPIRISRIRGFDIPEMQRTKLVSRLWPGDPYTFSSEEQYLREYAQSHFALSPEKGGWDTMRSVEIVSAGAIPLIPKLKFAHPLSMHFYPKTLLSKAWDNFESGALRIPTPPVHVWMKAWGDKHLSDVAQCRYLLRACGIDVSTRPRVAYIECNNMATPDYVSMGLFTGLTKLLGSNFFSPHVPSFLFRELVGDTSGLYGRGFGFSGELELQNSQHGRQNQAISNGETVLAIQGFAPDLIVVGGLEYLDRNPAKRLRTVEALSDLGIKIALVYGGDFPISRTTVCELGIFGTLFSREHQN